MTRISSLPNRISSHPTGLPRPCSWTSIRPIQKGTDLNRNILPLLLFLLFIALILCLLPSINAAAATRLPGEDVSTQMEAAGTLLRLVDTALFKWGARIFAGIFVMSAGWALKEQRFGMALILVIGAFMCGTAPKWVKNIFD